MSHDICCGKVLQQYEVSDISQNLIISKLGYVYILGIMSELLKVGVRQHHGCVLPLFLFVILDRTSNAENWRGIIAIRGYRQHSCYLQMMISWQHPK